MDRIEEYTWLRATVSYSSAQASTLVATRCNLYLGAYIFSKITDYTENNSKAITEMTIDINILK